MNKFISTQIQNLTPFNTEILNILNLFDIRASHSEIADVIRRNDSLHSGILKLANNPFIKRDIDFRDVFEILEIYKRNETKALLLFHIFDEIFTPKLDAYHISHEEFVQISLLRNMLVFNWLQHVQGFDKTILSATILVEFGRVFIDKNLLNLKKENEFYANILNCVFPQDFIDVEREFSGTDRESIDNVLFKHYNLDKIALFTGFSNAIDDIDYEESRHYAMIKIAKTAVNIYHRCDEFSIENALNLLVEYNLEQESFLKAVKAIKK